jgi:hypothetical protein
MLINREYGRFEGSGTDEVETCPLCFRIHVDYFSIARGWDAAFLKVQRDRLWSSLAKIRAFGGFHKRKTPELISITILGAFEGMGYPLSLTWPG